MKKVALVILTLACFSFVQAESWTIVSFGFGFSPDSITVQYGDTILFQLDSAFNAQEVNQATWMANDSTPVLGFRTSQGGGTVTGLSAGTHYYVSDSNAYMGMKGRIFVTPAPTVRFRKSADTIVESNLIVPVFVETNNTTNQPIQFMVSLQTSLTTASANLDFTFINRVFIKPPGLSVDTVFINVLDDQLIENDENIVLQFSNTSPNLEVTADSLYTLQILDNDTLSVSFVGAAFTYQESAGIVPVKVALSSPVAYDNSITVTLDTGNAEKGLDFICLDATTLNFPAYSIDTQIVWVELINDSLPEGVEQINFSLGNPIGGARLGISAYTIFIIDDDMVNEVPNDQWSVAVKLFPNPAHNEMTLQSEVPLENVRIFDATGRTLVQPFSIDKGNNRIDISSLAPGIYFLSSDFGANILRHRFIKNE